MFLVHSMDRGRWLLERPTTEARVVRGEKTASQFLRGIEDAVFFMDGDNR